MFNNKYGLTQAVLEGRKTQTRRVIEMPQDDIEYLDEAFDWDFRESVIIDRYAKYSIGEIVAIAQRYNDIHEEVENETLEMLDLYCSKGWNNKMFVKAELMPHQIKITNVRIERLQDISDEDCMSEGIQTFYFGKCKFPPDGYTFDNGKSHFDSPREAYAELIDKVGKKGDWDSNPYVFVYDFELLK